MAVGKGSLERAAKAGGNQMTAERKTTAGKTVAKKTTEAAEIKKTAPAKSAPKRKSVAAKSVIAATNEQVMEKIVYEPSSQLLERDAEPNEIFGLGDSMPVYYF